MSTISGSCMASPSFQRRNWRSNPEPAAAAPNRATALHKLFAVWWPVMKALLKRAGYGPDQLYMLGDNQMPEIAALVPKAGLGPDGELVIIYDEDAGF
jgi:hypothetical protein